MTQRLFSLLSRDEGPRGELWGNHRWIVAAVVCPRCGVRMALNYPLPAVDLSDIEDRIPGKWMAPEQFAELAPLLRRKVPKALPVRPQQSFGRYRAELKGKPCDLVSSMSGGWDCVTEDAYRALVGGGLKGLVGTPVEVVGKRGKGIRLVQLQVQRLVHLGKPTLPAKGLTYCDICRRHDMRSIDMTKLSVTRSSIPRTGDFLGAYEWDVGPIVTERFREIASRILRNAEFRELPITDE